MAITRRQFLKCSGLATAGSIFGPSLFGSPWLQRAFAETIGDRYVVVIYLDGGNDGLNTVTPADNGLGTLRTAYEAARDLNAATGGIGLTPAQLTNTLIGLDPNTQCQLAIHPAMTGLKSLYDLGKVAVVQNCGYPDYSLSHEDSRSIWQSGDPPRSYLDGSGWIGRHLAAPSVGYAGGDVPAIAISDRVTGELANGLTSVLAIQNVLEFDFPFDQYSQDDIAAKQAAYTALHDNAIATAQSTLAYIGSTGLATYQTSLTYPALEAYYTANRPPAIQQAYEDLGRGLAIDLREVAKIITGVNQNVLTGNTAFPAVQGRFFQVSSGGFDTHADQGGADPNGQHFDLLSEISDSIKAFYDDMVDLGIADKVLILTYSEFSRRIQQNENGTDHGSQAPMFIVGGSVVGGVYGNHPNLDDVDDEGNTKYSQDPLNDFRTTDFRDVYGTIMKHWLNMPANTVIDPITPANGVLRLDSGDPTLYWTAADLDMGFLP
jgi:uncharacterized protein (DUF1501 family)